MKEHHSGPDVGGRLGDPIQGVVFLDGVCWIGFGETKGEALGAGQVYLGRSAKRVESVAPAGESARTPGGVAHKEGAGR